MNALLTDVEVLDGFSLLAGAENDRHRSLLTGLSLVAVEPPEVQLHLARVRRFEVAEFEFDDYQPPHPTMEEQQVDVVVLMVDDQALLPLPEREIPPKFGQEPLKMGDQC